MKTDIIVDTNVLLDFLVRREPFYEDAKGILALELNDDIDASMTSNTVTDLFYLASKIVGDDILVRRVLDGLFHILPIVDVNNTDCVDALDVPMKDFEDAIMYRCAARHGAKTIITRNVGDFEGLPIMVLTPHEYLSARRTQR